MRHPSVWQATASAAFLTASLLFPPSAQADEPTVAVSVEQQLQSARPNVTTNTIISTLFPGTAQAYMGHIDHALALWGAYLMVFGLSRTLVPDTWLTGGQKASDMIIATSFLGMAGFSAVDAFTLTEARRKEIDSVLQRLRAAEALNAEELKPVQ